MITKEEILYKQDQINSMTQEEIDAINEKIKLYSRQEASKITNVMYSHSNKIAWFISKWYECGRNKDLFWKYRVAVTLLFESSGYKVKKCSSKFALQIGDMDRDLFYVELAYDEEGDRTKDTTWRRVYSKTRVKTPEEQAAWDKEFYEKRAKKNKDQFTRNCSKWGLKPTVLGKTYVHPRFGDTYTITGCNPRQPKFVLSCEITYKDSPEKSGSYNITINLFNDLKEIKEPKVKKEKKTKATKEVKE